MLSQSNQDLLGFNNFILGGISLNQIHFEDLKSKNMLSNQYLADKQQGKLNQINKSKVNSPRLEYVMSFKTKNSSGRKGQMVKVLKVIQTEQDYIEEGPVNQNQIGLSSHIARLKKARALQQSNTEHPDYSSLVEKVQMNPLTINKLDEYLQKEEQRRIKQKSLKKINKTIKKSLRRSKKVTFNDIKEARINTEFIENIAKKLDNRIKIEMDEQMKLIGMDQALPTIPQQPPKNKAQTFKKEPTVEEDTQNEKKPETKPVQRKFRMKKIKKLRPKKSIKKHLTPKMPTKKPPVPRFKFKRNLSSILQDREKEVTSISATNHTLLRTKTSSHLQVNLAMTKKPVKLVSKPQNLLKNKCDKFSKWFNFFNLVKVSPPEVGIKKGKKKLTYFVGPGNGHKLICFHFLARFSNIVQGEEHDNIWPGTEFSNFIQRSMFVWTQTTRRKYQCNSFSDYESVNLECSKLAFLQSDSKIIHESIKEDSQQVEESISSDSKADKSTEVPGTEELVSPDQTPSPPKKSNLKLSAHCDLCEYPEAEIKTLINQIKNQNVFRVSEGLQFDQLLKETFQGELNKKLKISTICADKLKIYNHINGSKHVGRKQLLTINVTNYFNKLKSENTLENGIIPETFIIKGESHESDLKSCLEGISSYAENSMWIIKPGEFSNRGKGIQIAMSKAEIKEIVEDMFNPEKNNCILVQRYLENPLLYKKRKFDIRCYCLMLKSPQKLSVFSYKYGYARTSSYEYVAENENSPNGDEKGGEDEETKKEVNLMVHLTNEAIQVKSKLLFRIHFLN